MSSRKAMTLYLVATAIISAGFYMRISPLRRALPWNASEVREWKWQEGALPDYMYHMSAKLAPHDFDAYVEKIGLRPHNDQPDIHGYEFEWYGDEKVDWWCRNGSSGSFSDEWNQGGTYAKYEQGRVFLYSFRQ